MNGVDIPMNWEVLSTGVERMDAFGIYQVSTNSTRSENDLDLSISL